MVGMTDVIVDLMKSTLKFVVSALVMIVHHVYKYVHHVIMSDDYGPDSVSK